MVEIPIEYQIVNISAANDHILMVTSNGRVLSFEQCSQDQLDNNKAGIYKKKGKPLLLENFNSYLISSCSVNCLQTLFLTDDGTLVLQGINIAKDKKEQSQEALLHYQKHELVDLQNDIDMKNELAVSIASGNYHWLVLTASGRVFSWGRGAFGSLGHGTSESISKPKQIKSLEKYKITSIAAGGKSCISIAYLVIRFSKIFPQRIIQ